METVAALLRTIVALMIAGVILWFLGITCSNIFPDLAMLVRQNRFAGEQSKIHKTGARKQDYGKTKTERQ